MKYKNNLLALSACMLLACLFVQCDKDCSGSYTIEGVLWNGTKNQPSSNTLIKASAGGQSSLFSGSVNTKDLGSSITNSDGRFKINYDCVNEDWGVSIKSSGVPGTGIDGNIPLNQNINKTYNIPDSVTIKVTLEGNMGDLDTVYLRTRTANLYYDKVSYYDRFIALTKRDLLTTNIVTFRIVYNPYQTDDYFIVAKGYAEYVNKIANKAIIRYSYKKLEPETNNYTVYY
jgi:hypothetical protein